MEWVDPMLPCLKTFLKNLYFLSGFFQKQKHPSTTPRRRTINNKNNNMDILHNSTFTHQSKLKAVYILPVAVQSSL